MTIYKHRNFAKHKLANLSAETSDEFIECNFMQVTPHTTIASGITSLTFTGCNLMNCDVPGDAVVEDCMMLQKNMCYWLHPTWNLAVETADCSHVVDTDTVTIDGELIDTIYHRQDTEVS
jgi:hypothetical protein